MDLSTARKSQPFFTSIAFVQQPITFTQWTSALQRVKALYLRGLLKPCSDRCKLLLCQDRKPPHPLHATYLHFYSALSTEGIARMIHNLSALKISTLETAKASYEAAAASLPVAEYVADDDAFQNSDTLSEHSFSTFGASHKTSTPSPSRPSSPICSSPSSVDSHYSATNYSDIKNPPPLQTNKQANSPPPPPSPPTFPTSTASWLQSRAHARYTAHLASFAAMLAAHIDVITNLIRAAEDAQEHRCTARLMILTRDADADARAEDRIMRIARLREKGWQRERFVPERYRELCKRALAEGGAQ